MLLRVNSTMEEISRIPDRLMVVCSVYSQALETDAVPSLLTGVLLLPSPRGWGQL